MRIPGFKFAVGVGRWLRSRLGPRAVILGYHRVSERSRDPLGLSVSPEHFASQLETVSRYATPVALGSLVAGLGTGQPLGRSVAVTFDDGYSEVLTHAVPLLERYGVPATVFVVPGCLGETFWWDRLDQIIGDGPLPNRPLRITVGQRTPFEWPRANRGDSAGALIGRLRRWLKALDSGSRTGAIGDVARWMGRSGDPPAHRALTGSELRDLARCELVAVGSHTSTHPPLPEVPPEDRRTEIAGGKAALETMLGRSVDLFSYPYGAVTGTVAAEVRQAGFRAACGSRPDALRVSSDRYDLPRFWVPNRSGTAFERWLRWWLGA